MTSPSVLVFGAAGQLGRATVDRLSDRTAVTGLSRHDVDVTDHAAVAAALNAHRPDIVVNCTAYNAVDQAEDDAVSALRVNALAVQSMAHAAAAVGAVLVHYSTDFVFDGRAESPYTEADSPNPQSVYAQSKLIGEWLAASAPRAIILRVESLFGGAAARSSIDRIVASLRAGETARVFVDRIVTPSYVDDVVEATWALVTGHAAPGVYHVVNSGQTTWHGIGEAVARLLGVPARLQAVKVDDIPMRAPRPKYCALSNAKLRSAGAVMPAWDDALARYLRAPRG